MIPWDTCQSMFCFSPTTHAVPSSFFLLHLLNLLNKEQSFFFILISQFSYGLVEFVCQVKIGSVKIYKIVLIYLSYFDGKIYPIVWNFVFGLDWVLLLIQILKVWNVRFNHFKDVVMSSIHLLNNNDTRTLLSMIHKMGEREFEKATKMYWVSNCREP